MSWFKEREKFRVAYFKRFAHVNELDNKPVGVMYLIVPDSTYHYYGSIEDVPNVMSRVLHTTSSVNKAGTVMKFSLNDAFDIKLYHNMQEAAADKFVDLL